MALQHPFHEHALNRRQLSEQYSSMCYICYRQAYGTAYCCEEDGCSFLLHESCALVEVPKQITKHPIHPDHPLHMESRQYCCDLCNIKFHASIVIATMPPLEEDNIIQHVAHDHSLTAFHVKIPNIIRCEVCQNLISGPAYGCHSCSFFIHETCSRSPQEMLQHPFHPEHPLTLHLEGDSTPCKACDTKGGDQLTYHCQECKFKLDVICAVLPLLLQDQQKEDSGLDHFSHQHRILSGHVEKSMHIKIRCAACKLEISGEVYYCLGCILFLHKVCTEELLKEMVHYLHPEHPLILLSEPLYKREQFECDCCQNKYSGMLFHCVTCEFNLDPKCALETYSASQEGLDSEIQHFGHEHPLMLRYFKKESFCRCNDCSMWTIGLAYSCKHCDYALHKSCAELPLKLEHQLHPPHPLILLRRTPAEYFVCHNCCRGSKAFAFCCSLCDFYLCKACATEMPTLKHQLHQHTLSFFQSCDELESLRCHSCRKCCIFDFYRCTPCNFNIHSSCATLPQTIQHKCHPYHPLVLFGRFVDGRPDDQYCDYCEEIRDPNHGVYRCEECWYTVHIGCVLPQVTRPVNPDLVELRKEIASLEETIKEKEKDLKEKEKDLEALKQKLISLQREAKELSN